MPDDRAGTNSSAMPQTAVSPNDPCPFLRALVATDIVEGHIVPLSKLSRTIGAASGEKGLKEKWVGVQAYLIALIANGLGPLRLLRSWWSGARLDALRDGPLDKHGSGSRILGVTAGVNESELERLAGFGKDRRTVGRIRTRADAARDHDLHGREFRSRQGRATSDRPSVDEPI